MSQTIVKSSGTGIGFTGLLTIVLLILKATGCIACSWWWVFAPLWIAPAIALLTIFLVLAFLGVVALID